MINGHNKMYFNNQCGDISTFFQISRRKCFSISINHLTIIINSNKLEVVEHVFWYKIFCIQQSHNQNENIGRLRN